jgi:hypothetical protein
MYLPPYLDAVSAGHLRRIRFAVGFAAKRRFAAKNIVREPLRGEKSACLMFVILFIAL